MNELETSDKGFAEYLDIANGTGKSAAEVAAYLRPVVPGARSTYRAQKKAW